VVAFGQEGKELKNYS
jgi:ABC-type multidrug transport system fused ATPase/permease subunit